MTKRRMTGGGRAWALAGATVAVALLASMAPGAAQQGGGFEPMPKFTPDIGTSLRK